MRVLILHDAVAPDARPDESDVLQQAACIETALRDLGHESFRFALTLDLEAARRSIVAQSPDLVFNLVESVDRQGRLIHMAPALLDALGVPYTGAPTDAMFCSSGKLVTKRLLDAAALPTPAWRDLTQLDAGAAVPAGKWIIKSAWEHASVGLDEDSVIESDSASHLAVAVRERLASLGGEGFAERYIAGREFNLAVIASPSGPRCLAPAEIVFEGYEDDKPRVVGYRAKWDESSYEYCHTPRRFDFPESDQPLLSRMQTLSLECWRRFNVRGYARVDFRVDNSGQPWILEINVNPCLSPDAGFAAALERTGIPARQAIEWIIADALRGVPLPAPKLRSSGPLSSSPDRAILSSNARSVPKVALRDSVSRADVDAVRDIVASTGFFYDHEIAVAVELAQEALDKGVETSGYHFLFADPQDAPGRAIAYACFGPIACTVGSWDLYWIAAHSKQRGKGLGRMLLHASEARIRAMGGRRVYIETSSRPLYEPTRAFYLACGYAEEARLAEFYGPEDDKIIYSRAL